MENHPSHTHHHHHANLKLAFGLNLLFFAIEIFGGIWTGSVAILSDALHDLGDSISIGSALLLEKIATKKRDHLFSYGYRRFSLLAAFLNGAVLIGGAVFMITESVHRFFDPNPVYAPGMILLAVVGLTINGYSAFRVSAGSTMNEKVLTWHLLEDFFGWVAILIAGALLVIYPIPYLDPALSLVFIVFTLWNAIRLFRQTIFLFLQGIPGSVSLETIEREILAIEGVESLHDSHIWSLDGETHVFTVHIVLCDRIENGKIFRIRKEVRELIERYGITHTTVELEKGREVCIEKN